MLLLFLVTKMWYICFWRMNMKKRRKTISNPVVLATILVFLAVSGAVFAGGQPEGDAPALNIPAQPRVYISPANGDGVQDELQLPFSSVVAPAADMVIVEYNLSVYDGEGALVFSVSEKQAERIGFFGSVFGGDKPRVTIPDTLAWDGTFRGGSAPDGGLVEDGEYTYQLTVIDDGGRFSRSAPFNVTVDNTPPEVTDFPEPDYLLFSPNGDGVRDTVTLLQTGSQELQWTLRIVDKNDGVVRETVNTNDTPTNRSRDITLPRQYVWDGKTAAGQTAPEGSYRLVITGTDRAGNSTTVTNPGVMELSLSAAQLSLSTADGVSAFSPNGDGSRDSLALRTAVSEPDGLDSWELVLSNARGTVYTQRGNGAVPAVLTLAGTRNDGSVLPDGAYSARLAARFENGNSVESADFPVVIDTAAPVASVAVQTFPQETAPSEATVFGGENRSRLNLEVVYDGSVAWSVALRLDGDLIVEDTLDFFLREGAVVPAVRPDGNVLQLSWNGVLPESLGGGSAPDGVYELVLRARDAAGNTGVTRPARAIKDGRRPAVAVEIDGTYLAPRAATDTASITVRPQYSQSDGIAEFLMEVVDSRGRMVRSEYKRQPFDRFEWTGLSNGNTVVPDGEYSVRLKVIYRNGHVAEAANAGPIIVDGTRPRIERFQAEYRRFSPDGDGERDTITIDQSVVPGDQWLAQIFRSDGTVVREQRYDSAVDPFVWDGTAADGTPVPDGEFRYVLSGTDLAGNSASEDMDIVLDTVSIPVSVQPPTVAVSVDPQPFSPDGDGTDETANIRIRYEAENTITRWNLEIFDPRGSLFRRFSGNGVPPATIRWDGTGSGGELVQSAADYLVRATLTDDKANSGAGETVAPVDILVMRDGDRLRIRIASIQFAANTPDLVLGTVEQLQQNLVTLRRLAEILNRYPDHDIIVEGHAAHVFLESAASMEREQRLELLPLSRRRAEEVMQALIILGVDRDHMTPIGYGGLYPVVPHSDLVNLWKNRRVEFLLERPE